MRMTLETLLEDRNQWQKNTIKRIRDSLLNRPGGSLDVKEEKLVVIYGLTQVGKTTLILYLMGISGDKHEKIYKVLRTGIPHGNSSTSTAIIYQRSSENFYELGYKRDSGIVDREKCRDEEEFIERLKRVRTEVENGRAATDILYIYIPHFYFDEGNEEHSNISILDLPGDGSQNRRECQHANVQIQKYMSLASVNIIACRADSIQSLETLQIPGNLDWRHMSHRYILVTTSSYGEGNIKSFFKKDKKERGSFLNFVEAHYKKELEKVLGSDCQMESFPVDIGDSLNKLCNEELKNYPVEDRKEVMETAAKTAEELRNSIQKRSGNSLKAAIDDLRDGSLKISEEKLNDATEKLRNVEQKISYQQKESKRLVDKLDQYEADIEAQTPLYKKYFSLNNACKHSEEEKEPYLAREQESMMVELKETLSENSKENGVLDDGDKHVSAKFEACMKNATGTLLEKYESDFEELSICKAHGAENIGRLTEEIYDAVRKDSSQDPVAELERFLYSRYSGESFWKRIFFKRKHDECINMIRLCMNAYLDKMWNYVYLELENILKRQKADVEDLYETYCQGKKNTEKEKDDCLNQLIKLQRDRENLVISKGQIEEQKKIDERLLNDFQLIAKEEYERQARSIEKYMENHQLSKIELMHYITYLALLEKDYNRTVGN